MAHAFVGMVPTGCSTRFRLSALALCGEMRAPYRWTIDRQGVATLAEASGRATSRRGRFDAVTGASFDSAESLVEVRRRDDGAREVLVRVTIEGLDLLGLVTADRLVLQLRGLAGDGQAEGGDPAFAPAEAELVNLRVLDEPVGDGFPAGGRLPIPDLGTLHLGEHVREPGGQRWTLVRLELAGRLQGELVAARVESGGGSGP